MDGVLEERMVITLDAKERLHLARVLQASVLDKVKFKTEWETAVTFIRLMGFNYPI